MPGADVKRSAAEAQRKIEARRKKYAGTNAEKYGLTWLMDPANAILHGALSSVNDFANTINPEPGYTEYFNIHNPKGIDTPEGGWKTVSDLTHLGMNWGLPIAALEMGGAPFALSIPIGAAVGEYAFNPEDPEYWTMAEGLPPEIVDQTPLRHLVRHDSDSEGMKRLKQGAGGLLFGSLIDAPVAALPALPGLALGTGAYMGLPAAANLLTPVDYTKWDIETLRDAIDHGDMDAYDEYLTRQYTHKNQREIHNP